MGNSTADQPDCPFCPAALVGREILAETPAAFLTRPQTHQHNCLIIPKAHTESLQDLPDSWWGDVKQLLAAVPGLAPSYNLSVNIGQAAGQTVKHLHFWVIPRAEGTRSSGKGLAKLIDEAN